MKSMYCIIATVFLLCFFAVTDSAQCGDTRNATGKATPTGAAGKMGSGSITGQVPVGAMGQAPVGAMGNPPVGAAGNIGRNTTGKAAPRGVMRRVYINRDSDRDDPDDYEDD